MGELALGLAGFGRFARLHAAVLADLPGCRVAAVCDPDPDALRRARETLPGVAVHPDLASMLDAGPLDAVDVVSDEAVHGEQVLACLERGLPVLVEKPLATDAAQARAIRDRAADAGIPVVTGHISRFDHRYATLRSAIAAGRLGRIVSVSARRGFSAAWFASFGARVHPVFESMIHDIDLVLWCLDAPIRSVYAQSLASGAQAGPTPDVLAALLTTDDGRIATLHSSWLAPAGATHNLPGPPLDPLELEGTIDARLDVVGTEGSASVSLDGGPWLATGARAEGSAGLWPRVHGRVVGALREELAHFVDCVATRRPSAVVPVAEAAAAVELAEAIVRSSEAGTPVAP